MADIGSWAPPVQEVVGDHRVVHMVASTSGAATGIAWAAGLLPERYASPSRVAEILEDLGKPRAAKYLRDKLPTSTIGRSGDLGEILGVKFAEQSLGYRSIARFWWKEHPNMAMRGDDILGFKLSSSGAVEFLKGEVKSSLRLSSTTVAAANAALRRDKGRPSPYTLSYVADRLRELGEGDLGRLIRKAQLSEKITLARVEQLLFTFTGNNPMAMLRKNTMAYRGKIRRYAVGLQVPDHQGFIAAVYERVMTDA